MSDDSAYCAGVRKRTSAGREDFGSMPMAMRPSGTKRDWRRLRSSLPPEGAEMALKKA